MNKPATCLLARFTFLGDLILGGPEILGPGYRGGGSRLCRPQRSRLCWVPGVAGLARNNRLQEVRAKVLLALLCCRELAATFRAAGIL